MSLFKLKNWSLIMVKFLICVALILVIIHLLAPVLVMGIFSMIFLKAIPLL